MASDGTIIIANSTDSWGGGYGYYVKIKHKDTFDTLYAHCSKICVRNGQQIKKGQVIDYVGTTGRSIGHTCILKSGRTVQEQMRWTILVELLFLGY